MSSALLLDFTQHRIPKERWSHAISITDANQLCLQNLLSVVVGIIKCTMGKMQSL
jgi:hypothetical protein